jgi:hypothetical protein
MILQGRPNNTIRIIYPTSHRYSGGEINNSVATHMNLAKGSGDKNSPGIGSSGICSDEQSHWAFVHDNCCPTYELTKTGNDTEKQQSYKIYAVHIPQTIFFTDSTGSTMFIENGELDIDGSEDGIHWFHLIGKCRGNLPKAANIINPHTIPPRFKQI